VDPREFVLTGAKIVLADRILEGGVVVRDGLIAEVFEGTSALPAAIDLEGDYLLPGLVEVHTDNLEKHLMPRTGVFWPPFAALLAHDAQVAAAGITTVFDAIALGDRDGRYERLEFLEQTIQALEASEEGHHLRADHFLHLRCEVCREQVVELYDQFAAHPDVRFVSLMDHTPGERQYADIDAFKAHLIKYHGETEEAFDARLKQELAAKEKYAAAHRKAIAERALAAGYVVASHDDAHEGHILEAKELGVEVSEFPTTEDAARAARTHGLTTVAGAPNVIRGGSHNGNVSAGALAESGLLDALSSDYMPVSLIHAPFRLRDAHGMGLPEAVALVTRNPARMMHLNDRGEIGEGLRADLVRVRETDHAPVVRAVWREGKRIV